MLSRGVRDQVAAGLIVAAVVALVGGLISSDWVGDDRWRGALLAIGSLAALGTAAWVWLRTRLVALRRGSTLEEVCRRIESAEREIWSFQISGGDFTINVVEAYAEWLAADSTRHLKILFANPDNAGLLESLNKLSGTGKMNSDGVALNHLTEIVRTSLQKYSNLSHRFPGRVDVRVYDCSPPCSIHAVDPQHNLRRSSIFVENYLPHTPWGYRSCFSLGAHHKLFALYCDTCRIWFDEADSYALADTATESAA